MSRTLKNLGIKIPPEENTPLIRRLVEVVEKLVAEVDQLTDGSLPTAPRPDHLRGHFGPTLRSFVLYQYYHNQVTEPLLLEQLRELGISISTGQVSRMLTEGHEAFHAEKDGLLPAAREVSTYFQTDDTTARHQGKNGHTLNGDAIRAARSVLRPDRGLIEQLQRSQRTRSRLKVVTAK